MGVDISGIISRETIELEHLNGRIIAVDAYNALYQFLSIIRQKDGTPLMNSDGLITSHLTGLLYRTGRFIEHGIKPCYVFDGVPPEQKHETILKRQRVRTEAKKKWEEAVQAGKPEEAYRYAQRALKLTAQMVEQSKELLDSIGIPYIEAPSEGESQASFMASQGSVWAVGSQDFDSLLFGAPLLVRNLTITGKRKLPKKDIYITLKPEKIRLENVLQELGITRKQLVDLAIVIGTDYNPGIKGIGPKTALVLVKKNRTAESIYKEHKQELPEIETLRSLFLEPETTTNYNLQWKLPNKEKTIKLMHDKYEFSVERIEKVVDSMTKNLSVKGTQSRLDQFF
ncbi:flap endonuclease-1 [archaeon]|nr:flap endonuclease-1 [archaeon]